MNVEDEYFKAIEDRDTVVMAQKQALEQKDKQIRTMIKGMKAKGLSNEDISAITGKNTEEIVALID